MISSSGLSRGRFYLIILLHQILTALAFPMAKLGLNEIDPYSFAFIRFTAMSLVYLPVLWFLRNQTSISGRDHARIFIIGLLIIPLNQVVYLVGQSLTSAGHSSLLFATTPVFIYILAILALGEKVTFRRVLGIGVALVGVYLVLTGGKARFGLEFLLGDVLIMVAVVAWAAGTVLTKPLAVKYGTFRVLGLALLYGSAVFWPYGLYRALGADFSLLTWRGYLSLFYMAIMVSVGAYFIWYWVIKYVEVSRLAVVQNIQPIIATAVAALILSETVSSGFILGGLVILGGVILTEL